MSFALDPSHMGPDFEVIFGRLLEGLSKLVLVKRVFSNGLDESSVFFLYLLVVDYSLD